MADAVGEIPRLSHELEAPDSETSEKITKRQTSWKSHEETLRPNPFQAWQPSSFNHLSQSRYFARPLLTMIGRLNPKIFTATVHAFGRRMFRALGCDSLNDGKAAREKR
jgi:hypothetical protein